MENIKIASVEHILVKKFNEGMNGCGKRCLSLITEVAGETHLSIKTVKSWIARHKAKSRKSDVDFSVKQKRKKVSINTQVLRGYDLWKQNQLLSLEDSDFDNRNFCFKNLGHNWSLLTNNEKESWNKKALLQRNKLLPLTKEEKEIKSKKLLKQLKKVVEELANMGNDVVAVTCLAHGGAPVVTATERGCQFLLNSEELNFQFKFAEFLKEISRLALPKHLQQRFRKCHIPYKKYVPTIISAHGLPDGQVLRYPSSMGTALLANIVENQNEINIVFDLTSLLHMEYNSFETHLCSTEVNSDLIESSMFANTELLSTEIDCEFQPVRISNSNVNELNLSDVQSAFCSDAEQVVITSNEVCMDHDYV
ncbi:uncharacterized protein LOC124813474 isoform X3 [Hydra vulgaris]|uniref:uncharacterized protein LOC124813474 isoform X3 n=1 Tax=Hydra vulgaris TaxID=6087 RepID=UPI001F5E9AF6|nr:uncharacterized protein LOC124813474 isoform X2 [Hydra vulgaris]XP_047143882.1 uncharacterized protein LOC105848957 isoform X2 [Hydra vulgaris]